MEATFTAPGINYVCKLDNLVHQGSESGSGSTIDGATYSISVQNTTPSSHTGYMGPGDECPSTGTLAWIFIPKGMDAFGVGANYQ